MKSSIASNFYQTIIYVGHISYYKNWNFVFNLVVRIKKAICVHTVDM